VSAFLRDNPKLGKDDFPSYEFCSAETWRDHGYLRLADSPQKPTPKCPIQTADSPSRISSKVAHQKEMILGRLARLRRMIT